MVALGADIEEEHAGFLAFGLILEKHRAAQQSKLRPWLATWNMGYALVMSTSRARHLLMRLNIR